MLVAVSHLEHQLEVWIETGLFEFSQGFFAGHLEHQLEVWIETKPLSITIPLLVGHLEHQLEVWIETTTTRVGIATNILSPRAPTRGVDWSCPGLMDTLERGE